MSRHERRVGERSAAQWESAGADDLLRLVAHLALEEADASLGERELTEADLRFLRWRAHEARARLGDAERAELRARAEAWAVRSLERRLAAGCGVALAGAPPAPLAIPARPVRRVMEECRAAGRVALGEHAVAAGAGRELWDEPCTATIERPAGLPKGDYLALRVAGESMTPLLHHGDLVLVKVGAPLVADAIVVARRPDDGYVVKRVGRIGRETIELESLNTEYPPVDVPNDVGLVLGTVVMRWCAHGARVAAEGA